jgi:hypothetical protein
MITTTNPAQKHIPEFHKASTETNNVTNNENTTTASFDNALKIHRLMKTIAGGAGPFSSIDG